MTASNSTKILASWRRPEQPPLTEREDDIVAAIRSYISDLELYFGQNAKWVVVERLQAHYGERLVCVALGFKFVGPIRRTRSPTIGSARFTSFRGRTMLAERKRYLEGGCHPKGSRASVLYSYVATFATVFRRAVFRKDFRNDG
jgi:hypothetical protein